MWNRKFDVKMSILAQDVTMLCQDWE